MTTLLLLGFGYTAEAVWTRHGEAFDRVIATARSPEKVDDLRTRGIDAFVFDGTEIGADLANALHPVTHAVSSIPPGETGDPALALLAPILAQSPNLAAAVYLSTTGVYGDRQGGWVDESTEPAPTAPRGHRRLAAERQWRAFGGTHGVPVVVMRLPGIYGPGKNMLRQLRDGTAKRLIKPGQVFSRIHVDDLADAIVMALDDPDAGQTWNVTDDEPAPPQDVVTFAARLMGVEPPPAVLFQDADLSPMARSFWEENKRVSNRGVREVLGLDLTYPTYREGLIALFGEGEGS
jgi:nucleoside-diphosphate-sugar epimerase